LAYVLRKNRDRTDDTDRLKTGNKVDGLFHDVIDRQNEYAVLESAKRLKGGASSTKWLRDQEKMRKLMRDIIGRLAREANHERRVVKDLEVFGISTAGFTVQISRITQPKGYVFLYKQDTPLTVPQDIKQLSKLPLVLSLILKTRVLAPWPAQAYIYHGLTI
jgi:hypothetical protein